MNLAKCISIHYLFSFILSLLFTKFSQVNLLDAKKSLNVNIFLRQFRIPTPEMMEHLLKGESEKFGAEKLRGLLKIIPEVDEVRL